MPSLTMVAENKSLAQTILNELNMSEKDLEDGVKHLQDWISKQPHLNVNPRESLLKSYIIGSKSVERSKTKLDALFTNRGKYEYLMHRDPLNINWDSVSYGITLPELTPEGYKVMMFTIPPGCKDYNYFQTGQLLSMEFELMLRDSPMIGGHIAICDMANLTIDILKNITITLSAQLLKMYQSVYPIRIKGLYFINGSSLLQTLLNTFIRPFCSQKLKDKILICSNLEELKEYIPLYILPAEYGGNAPSLDDLKVAFRKKMESERDWFLTEGAEKSDESKRVGTLVNENELQGTFRKLNID